MNNQTNPPSYPQPIFFNPETETFSTVPPQQNEQFSPSPSQPPHNTSQNHKPFPAELLKKILSNGSTDNLLMGLLSQGLQKGQSSPPDFAVQALASLLANDRNKPQKTEVIDTAKDNGKDNEKTEK